MFLIFRADADSKIGTGHLMRCLALGQSWVENGGKVIFITNCQTANLTKKLREENFEVVQIKYSYSHQTDWQITKSVLDRFPEAWCVVDGYHFDNGFYDLIRQNGNRVLVVDDTVRLPFYNADAILNQNIYAENFDYKCLPETKLLLGTNFTLLRMEFLKQRKWQRKIPDTARNILITMGGSDFHNQTLKVIRGIEKSKIANLQIRAVIGSSNTHINELKDKIENSHISIKLIENAQNMSELIKWSDLAISAAGSTCWELCFLGVPTVLIITAENQNGIANGLSESGFAESLGWFEQVTDEKIADTLNKLLPDKKRREKMSKIGLEIIDGGGVNRVIEILNSNS